ncbi:PREDICTED: uncharacterized protein LOC109390822 [Hipposideros armiger]|uniref:Uncharacterized protein LOC109390822 n=1 Tax=Hipposideros armiger TaxID=186990 RepID=A0A8B7SIW9_HIPAR|nr:PREDICTED: uncharacterized protein LOC109390822 [Hipposideros armiger]
MQALDLLLQTFVSENKSMDEVCFLLQHTEPWLKSDKSHERKRVVQSIFLLLKYLLDCMILTEEATPSVLGHQLGLLLLLCRDEDEVTWSHSYQCVYLLLQLPVQQKGNTEEFMRLNEMKNFEAKARRYSETKSHHLVKVGPVRAGGHEGLTAGQVLPQNLQTAHEHGICVPPTSPDHFTDGASGGRPQPVQGGRSGRARTLVLFPGSGISRPLTIPLAPTHPSPGGVAGPIRSCRF